MAYQVAEHFHVYHDTVTEYSKFGKTVYVPGTTRTEVEHSQVQERSLTYRLYAHFHPFVPDLVRRLIARSVKGLQSADTEYRTQVRLLNGGSATGGDNKTVTLAAGEIVTIFDGAGFKLADNTLVKCFGDRIVTMADETVVTVATDAQVTLPQRSRVTRSDGAQVTLVSDTAANLPDGKPRLTLFAEVIQRYLPSDLVQQPYPVKDLDFTSGGAYSVYNWELFFHTPLMLAIHLSKNGRFEEAQNWFHYLFDPTDDSDGPTPERFWKVKPFQTTDIKLIEEILVNLSSGDDVELQQQTVNSIGAWKDAPFRPHVIARYRQSAYMFKTVMAYLDNLVAWGDSLFRQDTGESINEATQLYVLAANILGPRPQKVPTKGSVRPQTYANLRKDLDALGNVLRKVETDIPFDLTPHPTNSQQDEQLITLRSIGNALYFCVPRNDKLLGYWDTVADRLFKIRNSLNIQGIFRQLPLFEPPIDPALLARAAAAGLDISAIVNGLNQPLPLVRFSLLVQKATEICQEVKNLGNNLLAAMEKEDNEALAILRARHERAILELVEKVRYQQFQEAIKAREGIEKTLANARTRHIYYERLLGREESEINIADLDALDRSGFDKYNFQSEEPVIELRSIEVDIAQNLGDEGGGKKLNSQEVAEMDKLKSARGNFDKAGTFDKIGAVLGLIPGFGAKFSPFGVGGSISFGGSNLAAMMTLTSSFYKSDAEKQTYEAGKSSKIGGWDRREQDWALQSNLAAGEITQTYKQLRAAQIREAIAEREWQNQQQQIKNAEEIEFFLTSDKNPAWKYPIDAKESKKTNQAFYTWLKREVKGLYGQCFQFAFDVAKKAERALQHELGNQEVNFVQYGYQSGKEGLLAGEKLLLDIKRMELAYHELNQREYELTKHVSLLQADPMALLQLRATGRCTVTLPESLFDMDGPGHYFRRVKAVAVSIPCVTGPYTSINCTLTLLRSSIRKNALLDGENYERQGTEDVRFSDHFGSLDAIVTSSGQNDSGLFETNLRDERYLPFEHSGVISEWQLELPANPSNNDPRQFDYATISDVILHIRYTAREGGGLLRRGALSLLTTLIEQAQAVGSVRLLSIRHEFPSEWAQFTRIKLEGDVTEAPLTLKLREEHYPYWCKGRLEAIKQIEILAKTNDDTVTVIYRAGADENEVALQDNSLGGLWAGKMTGSPLPPPIHSDDDPFTLAFTSNSMDDLWLAITWGKDA